MDSHDISRLEGKIDTLTGVISSQGERIATLEATVKGIGGNQTFGQQLLLTILPQVITGLIVIGGLSAVMSQQAKCNDGEKPPMTRSSK
jgi:hypothetical protein